MKSKSRLKDLQPHEVSLVGRAANRRTFLALKSEGGETVSEVIDAIIETEAENEGQFLSVLKTAGISDEASERMLAGYRLFNADRENLSPETFASLAGAMGFSADPDPDGDGDAQGIIKADGTINPDVVPDALKGAVEAITKKQEELQAENVALRTMVEKRESEELLRTFIQKAEGLPNLPTPAEGMTFPEALMGISQKAPEEFAVLDTMLAAANEMIEKSSLFGVVGRVGVGGGSAEAEIESLTKDRVAKSATKLTEHEAREAVLHENLELQARYLKESQENG